MNVLFKANSNIVLGSGHFVRCLNLALELKRRKWNVFYVYQELNLRHLQLLEINEIESLPMRDAKDSYETEFNHISEFLISKHITKLDWIVVDDYNSNANWDDVAKKYCKNLLVIDDLQSVQRNCDLLLDMNYRSKSFEKKTTSKCENESVLIGPEFALLDELYSPLQETAKNICRDDIKSVFINYGTLDVYSLTLRTVYIFLERFAEIVLNVVVQESNSDIQKLKNLELRNSDKLRLYISPDFLGNIMSENDFSIGAGGISLWERFALGLPAIVVSTSDNQSAPLQMLSDDLFVNYLGGADEVSDDDLFQAITNFVDDASGVKQLRDKIIELCPTDGSKRVADAMQSLSSSGEMSKN